MAEYVSTDVMAGRRAYLLDESSLSAVQERQIVRMWKGLSPGDLESMAKELRNKYYETNPVADYKTYTGSWRIVKVQQRRGANDQDGQIIETLRIGWETETTAATINASSTWRLVKITSDPVIGGLLDIVREIPYYAPANADGAITNLKAAITAAAPTITNPKVDGEIYSGDFAVGKQYITKDGDGSVRLIQTLHEVLAGTSTTTMGTPVKLYDYDRLNPEGEQEGKRERYFYIFRRLNPVNRLATIAIANSVATPPATVTLLGSVPSADKAVLDNDEDEADNTDFRVVHKEYKTDPETNTGELHVIFANYTWNHADASLTWANGRIITAYKDYDATNNTAGRGLVESRSLTGLDKTDKNLAITAACTSSSNSNTRVVVSVRSVERGDGEFEVHNEEAIAYTGTAYTDAVVIENNPANGRQEASVTRVWWRRTSTAKDALIIPSGDSQGEATKNSGYSAYAHDGYEINDHGDGTYDVIQRLRKPRVYYKFGDAEDDNTNGERVQRVYVDSLRVTLGSDVFTARTITETRKVYVTTGAGPPSGATDYMNASTPIYNEHGNGVHWGRVNYVGNGFWEAIKVTHAAYP